MNKIDGRFLNVRFLTKGVSNNPLKSSAGDQYIVGSNPTGVFEGATPNFIAYYSPNNGWEFIPPAYSQQLLNIFTGEFLVYEGEWIQWHRNDDALEGNLINVIQYMVPGYDTEPELPENKNSYYFNTTTKKLYDINNGWRDLSNWMSEGYKIIVGYSDSLWKTFIWDGSEFQEITLPLGLCIVATDNIHGSSTGLAIYYYNNTNFERIFPLETSTTSTSGGKEFYTETHTLTAEEVSSTSFTLNYSVESGEETNILCSVSGIIQPAGVAFEVSGNTLNWGSKTLDNASLAAGDVFVVHYVKASA